MLTAARNELLTRVGPGTPMGELLRRYWQPIGGASELEKNPIKPIRLMGENLVLYKDLSGTFGLVDRHCPHRRADMSYGWVEASGIRCSYHGWRYDETGACIDQPYEDTDQPEAVEGRLRDQGLSGARDARVCCGPTWGRSRRPNCRCGSRSTGRTAFARSCWPTCRATGSRPRRTPSIRCISNGCTTTGASRMRGGDKTAPKHLKLKFEEFEHGFTYKRVREGQSEEDTLLDRRPRRAVAERLLSRPAFRMARAGGRREHAVGGVVLRARAEGPRALRAEQRADLEEPDPGRRRPLDHQPCHQPGHRRLGRAGRDRRPHAGASAFERHRHHHDAQPLLRGDRGDQGRPRPEGRDPRSEAGAEHRPARHGARAEHAGHHARGIPERSAARASGSRNSATTTASRPRCARRSPRRWGSRFDTLRRVRHGRACPGHPRLACK